MEKLLAQKKYVRPWVVGRMKVTEWRPYVTTAAVVPEFTFRCLQLLVWGRMSVNFESGSQRHPYKTRETNRRHWTFCHVTPLDVSPHIGVSSLANYLVDESP